MPSTARSSCLSWPLSARQQGAESGMSCGGWLAPGRELGGGAEDVFAAVMPDDVEPALGVKAGAQVAVGEEDALLAVERPRDHVSGHRIDDGGAAATEDLLVVRQVGGKVVRES